MSMPPRASIWQNRPTWQRPAIRRLPGSSTSEPPNRYTCSPRSAPSRRSVRIRSSLLGTCVSARLKTSSPRRPTSAVLPAGRARVLVLGGVRPAAQPRRERRHGVLPPDEGPAGLAARPPVGGVGRERAHGVEQRLLAGRPVADDDHPGLV